MSRWRQDARRVIDKVIVDNVDLVENGKDDPVADSELWKRVRKAYPFGERKMWPYKQWLSEIAAAKVRIAIFRGGSPIRAAIEVKCPACGARPFLQCRPVGFVADDHMVAKDAELEGREEDAEVIRATSFHEARMYAAGLTPSNDTLPLFGGVS